MIREQKYGSSHPVTARALYNLGLYHSHGRDFDPAEACFRKALRIYEASLGIDHNVIANVLDRLAENYLTRGIPEEAERLSRRSKRIRQEAVLLPESPGSEPCLLRRGHEVEGIQNDPS